MATPEKYIAVVVVNDIVDVRDGAHDSPERPCHDRKEAVGPQMEGGMQDTPPPGCRSGVGTSEPVHARLCPSHPTAARQRRCQRLQMTSTTTMRDVANGRAR